MISLTNVTKAYRRGPNIVRALQNLNLEIPSDKFTVVMGRSGSGKSTLLHLVGCLDTPTSGDIVFNGRNLSHLTSDQRAKLRSQRIGFVFQRFNQISNLSALENVELPLLLAGMARGKARRQAQSALEQVGLSGRSSHRPTELSGGELQRVTIARALINDPDVLLADEPTGNLDTETGDLVISMLRQLSAAGKACIVVTHDPDLAMDKDFLVYLRDGKHIDSFTRNPQEVLQ